MNIVNILLSLLMALILFFLMNYLKRKNLSLNDSIIIPNIYMIIIASFNNLKDYALLILISYFILDILNMVLVDKKDLLINDKSYYKSVIITLIIGHLIYYLFLVKVENVFLDMDVFKNFIWLLIILYFIKKLNITSIKLKTEEKENFTNRYQEYVIVNYAKFKNKYGYLIKSNDKDIENIIYSFLIYENYLHGYLYNYFKDIKNKIIRKESKYGILNIESDHFISNEEGIVILKERLEIKLRRTKKSKDKEENLKKLINEKYKESHDYKEIMKIYNIIEEFNKGN